MSAPTVTLNDGRNIPAFGLGTFARERVPGACQQAVEWALDAGYRHLDTATLYQNEEEVGRGLANKINDGTVTREDVWVTTKLWCNKHAKEDVLPALKESLARLGLDYVDLYLIHCAVAITATGEDAGIDYMETWEQMEELQRLGLAKSIGVSNFSEEQIARVLEEGKVKPSVNQLEVNLTLSNHDLVKYCQDQGILVTAYTPLGAMSATRKNPAVPLTLDDPQLVAIANKYGKDVSQIIFRYLVERGTVPLPKSYSKQRIESNIQVFDFKLSPEDIKVLESFNIGHRCVISSEWKTFKYYPFEL